MALVPPLPYTTSHCQTPWLCSVTSPTAYEAAGSIPPSTLMYSVSYYPTLSLPSLSLTTASPSPLLPHYSLSLLPLPLFSLSLSFHSRSLFTLHLPLTLFLFSLSLSLSSFHSPFAPSSSPLPLLHHCLSFTTPSPSLLPLPPLPCSLSPPSTRCITISQVNVCCNTAVTL